MRDLTIILPTGRMQTQCFEIIKLLGIKIEINDDRKYFFYDKKNGIKILMMKPSDIIQVMNEGIGDLCFIGTDLLLNQIDNKIIKICDLNFGLCKMVIASKEDSIFTNPDSLSNKTIASKYDQLVVNYFNSIDISLLKVVKMNGSLELAPSIGIADAIVDIKESGQTLKSNNLKDFFTIADINMTLSVNNTKEYLLYDKRFQNLVDSVQRASRFLYGHVTTNNIQNDENDASYCLKKQFNK